jgi:3-oxoacyl-[acyl-carrier protein] reductase
MKNALITGAGSGIGQAIAVALADAGFEVGLGGRRTGPLRNTVDRITRSGGQAWSQSLDIRQPDSVQSFIQKGIAKSSKIDLLVNSAGTFGMRPFEQTDPNFWEEMIDTNLNGIYRVIFAAWPYLSGGQIINIGSVAGKQPYPGNAAYSASKYGLTGLSEVLAMEGKERQIRVHLIQPGNTQTTIWDGKAPKTVQNRMMQPEQVAEVVRWLAVSPETVAFDPITVRPSSDPWKGEE